MYDFSCRVATQIFGHGQTFIGFRYSAGTTTYACLYGFVSRTAMNHDFRRSRRSAWASAWVPQPLLLPATRSLSALWFWPTFAEAQRSVVGRLALALEDFLETETWKGQLDGTLISVRGKWGPFRCFRIRDGGRWWDWDGDKLGFFQIHGPSLLFLRPFGVLPRPAWAQARRLASLSLSSLSFQRVVAVRCTAT